MKLKLIQLIIFLGLYSQMVSAQYLVSGTITDAKTKKAIPGASVYVNELKMGANTNKDGRFELPRLKAGSLLLEISSGGFKKQLQRVIIHQDTALHFSLMASVSELEEVVVTAVSRSTALNLSPIIIKPVDATTLLQNSATNLIDGLKNVPGVSQITTGAGISKPTIRGLGYNRVISLYNGIRQEGQQWGDEHGIEIDEYSIDRVEIVKGPGSLMYGSDGIAGVINFLTPKAPALGQIKTQFTSNFQTNNQLMGYSLSNAGNKGGIQWLGRMSYKLAGNYKNSNDGKVYNSGLREHDGNLFIGVNRKWGYAHVTVSSFNTTLNMPEGDRDSLGNFVYATPDGSGGTREVTANNADLQGYFIGFPHQKVSHFRVLSNQYFLLKNGTLHLDLGFQNNQRKEFGDVLHPNDMALFFDLNTYNYQLRYNLKEHKGWETSVGSSGMYQTNKNRGLEFLIPEYQLLDMGGFACTQKSFGQLTLAGGIRIDNRRITSKKLILNNQDEPVELENDSTSVKFAGFTKNYSSYAGSVGLSYQLNKQSTLKFNLSRGFRAPNIGEIASNGKHEGTLRYEYGTVNLQPETSHQIDLAYFLHSDHLSIEVSPFVNFIRNYIYSEKMKNATGGDSIPDPNDPTPAFQFTQGNATLLGGEIYVDLHPHPLDWLHLENTFSYVQATQQHQPDSTRYLPFIPAPKYRGELKAQFNKVGKRLSNWYAKVAIDHYFEQNRYFKAYETETATPAYTLLSAGVGTSIQAFGVDKLLSLYISADNLTDLAFQSNLSRLKYAPQNPATGRTGIFNMGRNLSVKMVLNF